MFRSAGASEPLTPTDAADHAAAPRVLDEAMTSVRDAEGASVRPSLSRMSLAHQNTAAGVLDRSDLSRMQMFCAFGVIAPSLSFFVSVRFGGDPSLQRLYWIGSAVVIACNIALFILASRIELYRPTPVAALWLLSNIAFLPALLYIGPFSSVLMVNVLLLVFISLSSLRRTAFATAVIHIGGQLLIALPILLGWTHDRSINAVPGATQAQLWQAEGHVVALLIAGFLLGRWARAVNTRAFAELERAMRVIGDKEQALAEVSDDARRVNRANEGRWSHQAMGSFTLGLVLGRGAMGEVYEAVRRDGTPAAVKLLNARSTDRSGMVERFYREMAIAARLESPHIVQVYELSPHDAPVPYIAMERLYGTDLASRLLRESRIPSDELVVMLDHVARGLEVARGAGVVHRDLKPHNLFFHAGTTWKILDFGVSKLIGSEGTLTGNGIVGTPQYMAPEQAAGGEISHRSDVYALGAIAYRCLTGRALFSGRDITELVYQVVHARPIRPGALGRVPSSVEDVLAIALAKDPRRRFPSAQAFAHAFMLARRGRAASLAPPPDAWR